MPFWLVPLSLAAEPVVVGGPDRGGLSVPDPAQRDERILPWATVGLAPAVPESPAIGPDLLALGPRGLAAVYDPLGKRVIVVGGATFPVAAADDLAFTPGGALLVMDDSARTLSVYTPGGVREDARAFPGLVPPGGTLGLDGTTVCSVDVFGACHPLATVSDAGKLGAPAGPALRPASRRVEKQGDSLLVDGQHVATVVGRGGGRVVGDWLVVEVMDDGAVTRRAIPLDGGAVVPLPVRGRLYAPARDLSAGPDGTLGWIDPRADGLHLVRVSP